MQKWVNITNGTIDKSKWKIYGGATVEDHDSQWWKITGGTNIKLTASLALKSVVKPNTLAQHKNYYIEVAAKESKSGMSAKLKVIGLISNFQIKELRIAEQRLAWKHPLDLNTVDDVMLVLEGLKQGEVVYVKKDIAISKMNEFRTYKQPKFVYGVVIDHSDTSSGHALQGQALLDAFQQMADGGANAVKIMAYPDRMPGTRDQKLAQYCKDLLDEIPVKGSNTGFGYFNLAKKYGMTVDVAWENLPSNGHHPDKRMNPNFWNPDYSGWLENGKRINFMDEFVIAAEYMAKALKDRDEFRSLQIVSEAVGKQGTPYVWATGEPKYWYRLSERVIAAVRKYSNVWVSLTSGVWGSAGRWFDKVPFDDDKIIYTYHNYQPHSYTHQGIHGKPAPVPYTTAIRDDALQRDTDMITYQKRNNGLPICNGAHSTSIWCPEAEVYLKDTYKNVEKHNIPDFLLAFTSVKGYSGWDQRYTGTIKNGVGVMGPVDLSDANLRWKATKDHWAESRRLHPETLVNTGKPLKIANFNTKSRTTLINTDYGFNSLLSVRDNSGRNVDVVKPHLVRFGGLGDYIDVIRGAKKDRDFTIMIAFTKPENISASDNFIVSTGTGTDKIKLSYNSSRADTYTLQIGKTVKYVHIPSTHKILSLCVVWDTNNKTLKYAINGGKFNTPDTAAFSTDTNPIVIGAEDHHGSSSYKGYLVGKVVISEKKARQLDYDQFWSDVKDINIP